MNPFQVRSKVCIAPIHVRSKVCKFAPHMEGSHADFALHMKQRHSYRDLIKAKTASFTNFQKELFKTTNIIRFCITYVTNCENQNILREGTFNAPKILVIVSQIQ